MYQFHNIKMRISYERLKSTDHQMFTVAVVVVFISVWLFLFWCFLITVSGG